MSDLPFFYTHARGHLLGHEVNITRLSAGKWIWDVRESGSSLAIVFSDPKEPAPTAEVAWEQAKEVIRLRA